MKVGIKKLDGVIGDMELVKKQTVSYETMYSNKLRTTTEFVYRIELIFRMSDGSTQSTPAVATRTWHHTAMSAATFTLSAILAHIATKAICKRIRGRN